MTVRRVRARLGLAAAGVVVIAACVPPAPLVSRFGYSCDVDADCTPGLLEEEGSLRCDQVIGICVPVGGVVADGGEGTLCPTNGAILVLNPNTVDAFDCGDTVPGNLVLEGLDNVDALRGVVDIEGSLTIEDCPDLATLLPLENLAWVGGDLNLVGTDLTNLSGLAALEVDGNVALREMQALTSLNGLQLDQLGANLIVEDCDSLVTLGDPALPDTIGSLYIADNAQLESLDGLEELRTILDLEISNNDALVDVSALCGLDPGFSMGGIMGTTVVVTDNDSLPDYEARCVASDKIPLERLMMQQELELFINDRGNVPGPGTCACIQ